MGNVPLVMPVSQSKLAIRAKSLVHFHHFVVFMTYQDLITGGRAKTESSLRPGIVHTITH